MPHQWNQVTLPKAESEEFPKLDKQEDVTSQQPFFASPAPDFTTVPTSSMSSIHWTTPAGSPKPRVDVDRGNAHIARALNEHYICSDDSEVVLVCRYGFCSTEYECGWWKRCVEGPARCI